MNDGLPRLRPYQLAPARAIIDSVRNQRGLTFTVEMSRQAGKNETSAQLEASLLVTLPSAINIKAAPTADPQVRISIRRLRDILRAARVPHHLSDNVMHVGASQQLFLSGEPTSNVVGHTATHLLEVDEAQDFDIEKYDKDFRPMAAANNATTVLYGTAWSEIDLLHRERQAALNAERTDGVRRAFVIPWPDVAAHNPAYGRYVSAERIRLGEGNPAFFTQYELRPIPSKGRLFDANQLEQLHGDFPRRTTRPPASSIVAGLDIAGGDDGDPTRHDRTVLTLAAVSPPSPADPLPANHAAVLHVISWQGTPHDQLLAQLLDLITIWRPSVLAVDATGLGETTARILASRNQRTTVIPLKFTRPAKSSLGFALITAASTGRLKIYADDLALDTATLWHELRLARADSLPGGVINFYVDPADGHDDYLISLALLQHAVDQAQPRIARGRTP